MDVMALRCWEADSLSIVPGAPLASPRVNRSSVEEPWELQEPGQPSGLCPAWLGPGCF